MMSINNKLVLEPYKHKGKIKANTSGGFATIAQKSNLVGLKALEYGEFKIGSKIYPVPKGSMVYFKEDTLHTQEWSTQTYTCNELKESFIIAEANQVVMIGPVDEGK